MTETVCPLGVVWCNCESVVPVSPPKRSKVREGLVIALLAVMSWFALFGALVTYDRVMNPSEDSGDILLNCYVYGDGDCGPDGPWHGFINLF